MFNGLFGVMFVLVFALVFGIILFTIIQEVSTWNKITGRRTLPLMQPLFQSGDRLEFRIQCYDYGMIAEGDCEKLSFQGAHFLGFERR